MASCPILSDYLTPQSKERFAQVLEGKYRSPASNNPNLLLGLSVLNIPYVVNPRLVRGLDYYCHTCFEFTTDRLGAQSALIAGGRYDDLIQSMGGNPTPGIGFVTRPFVFTDIQ